MVAIGLIKEVHSQPSRRRRQNLLAEWVSVRVTELSTETIKLGTVFDSICHIISTDTEDVEPPFRERFSHHRPSPGSCHDHHRLQVLYGRVDFEDTNVSHSDAYCARLPSLEYASTRHYGFHQDYAKQNAGLDDD